MCLANNLTDCHWALGQPAAREVHMRVAQVLLGHAQHQAPCGGRPLRAALVWLDLLRQLELQQQPLQCAS